MNQLRLGQIADGRASLETSFKGDPYNVWVKNTLDLLDTYKNYDVIKSDRFEFMIEKSGVADSRRSTSKDLAEQAYTTFSKKYGVHAAAADSHRGVSQPRGLLRAHRRPRRTRRARRELRNDARVRLAGGEGRRSVQLGLDGVARARAHVHARRDRQSHSALVLRRVCRSTRSTRRGPAGASTCRRISSPRSRRTSWCR